MLSAFPDPMPLTKVQAARSGVSLRWRRAKPLSSPSSSIRSSLSACRNTPEHCILLVFMFGLRVSFSHFERGGRFYARRQALSSTSSQAIPAMRLKTSNLC
jgi:hypothetical protein